jgi:3-oxoacyl-[acyl-carrier protein] reductase
MSKHLTGKVALITGGSRGIGAAIVNPATGDFAELLLQVTARPRYANVDEIAALVAYLAGPEAAYVTGASLSIDGGFTA